MGLCGRRGVVICHIFKENTTKDVIPGMARAEIGDLTNDLKAERTVSICRSELSLSHPINAYYKFSKLYSHTSTRDIKL